MTRINDSRKRQDVSIRDHHFEHFSFHIDWQCKVLYEVTPKDTKVLLHNPFNNITFLFYNGQSKRAF